MTFHEIVFEAVAEILFFRNSLYQKVFRWSLRICRGKIGAVAKIAQALRSLFAIRKNLRAQCSAGQPAVML